MASDNEIIAPVYRYFTTDLLSNEVLMEIPFSGVSWERALKAGGSFSGNIPVIPSTQSLELYNTTMPGQTGLYVVRNGKVVWGGIIWSRSYDVKSNVLAVSATEFTSYLHHRLIWKTVNFQYSATVTVGGGTCAVVFDNGSTTALIPGASVQLEFYEPENFTYNGYYNIAGDPPPTQSSFSTTLAAAVASIVDITRTANIVTVNTDGFHGFNTGDSVTISGTTTWDGTYVITADQGSASSVFTFIKAGSNTVTKTYANGLATRPIPAGTYTQVTVTTRADTYDYMRGIVTSIFEDFMGIDFADDYLTPGLSYEIDIINKKLGQEYATMSTAEPHQLAVGQAVEVSNVGFPFDGEYEVVQTPDANTFMYQQSGQVSSTPIAPIKSVITARAIGNLVATIYTSTPHGYKVGQTVNVDAGDDIDGLASAFNGMQTITSIPSPTSFSYSVIDTSSAAKRTLTSSTAQVGNTVAQISSRDLTSNVVSVATELPSNFAVGNSVTVRNLNVNVPVTEKSLDAALSVATLTTSVPHELQTGDVITVSGLEDVASPTNISTASTTGTLTAGATWRTNQLNNPSGRVAGATGYGVYGTGSILVNSGNFTYLSNIPVATALSVGITLETMTVGTKLAANTTYSFTGTIGGVGVGAHLQVTGTGVASVNTPDPSPVVGTMFLEGMTFTTGASGSVAIQVVNAQAATTANTATVQFQDMLVEVGTKNLSRGYFYGSTATQGIYSYGWTGTTNNSPSVEKVSQYVSQTFTMNTSPAHNFKAKDTVRLENMTDNYTPTAESVSGGLATLTIGANNLGPGNAVNISNVEDNYNVTSRKIASGVATLTLNTSHGFKPNDSVTVAKMDEQYSIVSKEIQNYTVILTTSTQHNIQVSQQIVVSGLGQPFDSTSSNPWVVTAVTETRIFFQLPAGTTHVIKTVVPPKGKSKGSVTYTKVSDANAAPTKAVGTVTCADSVLNGNFVVTATPATNQVQFSITANDVPARTLTKATLSGDSPVNGSWTVVGSPNATQITFYVDPLAPNLSNRSISSTSKPVVSADSYFNGSVSLSSVTRTSISWKQNTQRLFATSANAVTGGYAAESSIFNGTRTITAVPTPTTLKWSQAATSSVLETVNSLSAYVRNTTIFNGTYTITAVDPTSNTFRYARTHGNLASAQVSGTGLATVSPIATVSTYGSYPGNTDIGIDFSTRDYSGVNVTPTAYRGYALTNAGTALDSYSGTTDGFDYRIDCDYDEVTNQFTKTFILLPIDFPNPPPPGVPSDPSRFGADRLVFEYPGNVIDVKLDESAENSATRFFAVGNADLGEDAADPYAAASATDLLNSENSRKWPILDDSESISDVTDENVLYAYAAQYLAENRPPNATFTVSIDGSLQPTIDTFAPGDWCSVIVDDPFLQQRLASNLEPRNTVIVRKIDSFKVSVPDGVTFPETVDLTLVAEWDVDKIGS